MNNNYIQPFNLNLTIVKNLSTDYDNSSDPVLRSSISTVIGYKISTLSGVASIQNQNLLSQISSIKLQ